MINVQIDNRHFESCTNIRKSKVNMSPVVFVNFSYPTQIQREVAVVPRMRTPEHISENFLLWDWTLSENDMLEIHDLNRDNRLYLPLIEGQPWCSDHPHYPFKINSI